MLFRRCLDADYDMNEQRYINNKSIKKKSDIKKHFGKAVTAHLIIDAKFDWDKYRCHEL